MAHHPGQAGIELGVKSPRQPSATRRRLGRSRPYTRADIPRRLLEWHAPRANRWEHLGVEAGALDVEWLEAGGVRTERLAQGHWRWIAPGTRWRIAGIDALTRFVLEIHADESTVASAPQPLRAALLEEAPRLVLADQADLATCLADLAAGQRCLLMAGFDLEAALRPALLAGAKTLCWHPLEAGPGGAVALLWRASRPVACAEYLARDHALIEAALAGALRGDRQCGRWLRNALARHLYIEEERLFPAWLQAGGNAGWVRGLRNEHRHLRTDLERLDDPVARRRFLLLLDGHDEKEEQIVYPDIIVRLRGTLDELTWQVMLEGLTPPASTARGRTAPGSADPG